MKRQPLPDPIKRRMDAAEEECERASRIVRDLLVFARRRPPERKRTDLNKVIQGLLSLQAPEFDLNRVRVATDLDPVPPVMVDPHQLQQVFLNLFTNARYAMKSARGEGTLTVRSSRQGSEVAVQVEDDGPGIPAEYLGRIFDPFFTTKGAGEGTGLGLSLSIGIIESHGGRMEVENVPGKGARFTVRIPIGEVDESPEPAPTTAEPVTTRRTARVLIVDDEPKLRATLVDVFVALGHQVEEAATGEEALAQIERSAFDVVTLDLRLPDIDGKVVWQRIVSRHPSLAGKIIFMTGDTMSPDTQRFLKEAGRPVLIKPLTIDRVSRLIDEILQAEEGAAGKARSGSAGPAPGSEESV
jgi:CheY-like chemotaxis protein